MTDLFKLKIKNYQGEIYYIPNWGDPELISPNKELGFQILRKFDIQDKFVFQYAGNLGRAQGIRYIIQAASGLKDSPAHFLLFGDGVYKEEIIYQSKILGNVTYGGAYDRQDTNRYLNACDVAIITLLKGFAGLGVPSKTYDIMAAGKPILFIGDAHSEIARMIKEEHLGLIVEPNSPENIIYGVNYFIHLERDILTKMGKRARDVLISKYSKKTVMREYGKIFNIM